MAKLHGFCSLFKVVFVGFICTLHSIFDMFDAIITYYIISWLKEKKSVFFLVGFLYLPFGAGERTRASTKLCLIPSSCNI